jgi:sugar/nucleoside kinase (ribokinase family)
LKDQNLEDSLKFANAAAALKVQKLGARTVMPSFKQVKEFLIKNKVNLKQGFISV